MNPFGGVGNGRWFETYLRYQPWCFGVYEQAEQYLTEKDIFGKITIILFLIVLIILIISIILIDLKKFIILIV